VQLSILTGPREGETIEVDRELLIGRSDADLEIEDPELSRRHAAVRPVPGAIEIEDLGSLNGTTVNGERISEPVRLFGGEQVKLGKSTLLARPEAPDPGATVLSEAPPITATVVEAPPTTSSEERVPALRQPEHLQVGPTPEPPDVPMPESAPASAPLQIGPVATLLWGPTAVCLLIILATAVAEVVYFATR